MGVWFNVTVTQHIYYSTVEKKHSFPEVSSRGWHSLTMTSVSIIICLHVCSRTVDNMKIIKKNKLSVNRWEECRHEKNTFTLNIYGFNWFTDVQEQGHAPNNHLTSWNLHIYRATSYHTASLILSKDRWTRLAWTVLCLIQCHWRHLRITPHHPDHSLFPSSCVRSRTFRATSVYSQAHLGRTLSCSRYPPSPSGGSAGWDRHPRLRGGCRNWIFALLVSRFSDASSALPLHVFQNPEPRTTEPQVAFNTHLNPRYPIKSCR